MSLTFRRRNDARGTTVGRRLRPEEVDDNFIHLLDRANLVFLNVVDYGATGDGVTDDTTSIQTAIDAAEAAGGGRVWFPQGTYRITAELTVEADDVHLEFADAAFTVEGNVGWIRFGASAASNAAYNGMGMSGRVRATGSGAANTSNTGITIRNVSYGHFFCSLFMTGFGGFPFWHSAFGRGNQHNKIGGGWYLEDNPGGMMDINAGAEAGGYINDNCYDTIRGNNKTGSGGVTQWRIRGLLVENNTFIQCSSETQQGTDTLLDNDTGTKNTFLSLRLDGVSGTNTYDGAAAAIANLFIHLNIDGDDMVDASNASFVIGTQSGLPFIRIGSAAFGADSWEMAQQVPGSINELHLRYGGSSDGIIRFPDNTEVFYGNRVGGDNAPIEIVGEDKKVRLRTLSTSHISTSPMIEFDGENSSGGNEGTIQVRQQARGLNFEFSTAGDFVRSSQGFGLTDGIAEPTVLAGTAILYIDQADGNLKVKFGDGFVTTVAVDA
jgi:hypothetical protein